MTIRSFSEEYAFLHNEFPCSIEFGGERFRSVAEAYRKIRLRMEADGDDWKSYRVRVMTYLVRDKFIIHQNLAVRLLKTRPRKLVFSNMIADSFWGMVNGFGENRLGIILMEIRELLWSIKSLREISSEPQKQLIAMQKRKAR